MKIKIINVSGLFLLMLVTGVFWGTWFTLTRSLPDFSAGEFIHIGKVIIANVAVPMRILMPLCIIFMLLSILFYPQKKTLGFYFNIAAFILIIITLLITLLILVPIDNQIKIWTIETIPVDWQDIRSRWDLFHTIRTFTSLTSLALFELAVMKIFNLSE